MSVDSHRAMSLRYVTRVMSNSIAVSNCDAADVAVTEYTNPDLAEVPAGKLHDLGRP